MGWGMGSALHGVMGRVFLLGPTLHEGFSGQWIASSHSLLEVNTPAARGSDPEERCPHLSAPISRSRKEGLMRGRLRRGLGVGWGQDDWGTIVFSTPQYDWSSHASPFI